MDRLGREEGREILVRDQSANALTMNRPALGEGRLLDQGLLAICFFTIGAHEQVRGRLRTVTARPGPRPRIPLPLVFRISMILRIASTWLPGKALFS